MTPRAFLGRHAINTAPLRHPAFRRLFVGVAVSNYGYQFTAVAVPVQMFALTDSSLWVGLLGVSALVPLVIFGIWGGAVADVVDRRKLLLASSVLMWATTLGLLAQAVLRLASPHLLLALVAVQAMAFAVSSPTRQAIVPRLVPPEELAAANTLKSTVFMAGGVAGPLSAGVMLAYLDVSWVYAVDALAFTVALWAASRLPPLPPLPEDGDDGDVPAGAGWSNLRAGWSNVRAGFAYLVTTPILLLSFVIDIAAMVLALPRALFPEVASERFGPAAVGWLYAAIGIGSVVAGLTSGWISRVRRHGLALVTAVVVWGLAVAAAGAAPWLWLVVFLLAVGGAADMVSAVYRMTILQAYAPDRMQGRMQGIFIAVVAGGPRLGDLRAGATAALAGPTIAWVGGGVAAAVVALVLALAFPVLLRYVPSAASDGVPVR